MNENDMNASINSLAEMGLALDGRISAQEAITTALVAAIGNSIPPLLPAIQDALQHSHMMRSDLEEGSLAAFDQGISNMRNLLAVLQR